jgi:nucleotide-binding universal stress UspA family protein
MPMPVIPVKVERILVPVSLCSHSEQAFRLAHDLAQRFDSEICAIHVMADPKEKDPLYSPEIREADVYDRIFRQRVEEMLEQFGASQKALKTTRSSITHGNYADEILRQARDIHAHLIVMGTHTEKTLQQSITGSTMSKVLKYTPCPVLVIRYPPRHEEQAAEAQRSA